MDRRDFHTEFGEVDYTPLSFENDEQLREEVKGLMTNIVIGMKYWKGYSQVMVQM